MARGSPELETNKTADKNNEEVMSQGNDMIILVPDKEYLISRGRKLV